MDALIESSELVRAVVEAEDIAANAQQELSSAHLLLAFFTFPNRAQVLLSERGIDEGRILDAIRVVEAEPKRTVLHIRDRARDIARGAQAREVDCLHALIALTRLRDTFAYRLLERTGVSLTSLRNVALSYITGSMPRRYRALPEETSPAPPARASTRVAPAIVLEREEDEFSAVGRAVDAAAQMPRTPRPTADVARATPAAQAPQPRPSPLEEIAPTLASCGVDLTDLARRAGIDRVVGRDHELERLVDILGKRRSNNPVLVGPPGVGKTAIVEGLAVKMVSGDEDTAHLADRFLVALNTGALVAGTSLRGAFSERMGAIKAEVAASQGRIIVFIDELHTLIGAGTSGEGAQDAANELKTALARGEFPCIGATTQEEFKKYIEKDAALERRFDPIYVEEPSPDEALLILEGAVQAYAEHHSVEYGLEALHAAVTLSHRFIPDRKLPDKAFAIVDLAGSRARRHGASAVKREDVARIVHEWSGVPMERLVEADTHRLTHAEQILGEKLIGHARVVHAVCAALRRGFAGLNGRRPMGSFLFLGPTGVGKTELVKIMAEFLFGRRDAMVRMDMSELSEKHAVARLVGAQPGYVGYEEGGQLTEALRRRPFQVVLFDEIEKAHPDVLNVLLQILDEGHLTDSRGRRIGFANTLVVLTSNLGSGTSRRGIGFGDAGGAEASGILEAARSALPAELWARLDEQLVFAPLSREEVRRVAALQLAESGRNLFAERELTLRFDETLLDFLLEHGGYNPDTGARGMRQTIQRFVEAPIAEQILQGALRNGDVVHLAPEDQAVAVTVQAAAERRRA